MAGTKKKRPQDRQRALIEAGIALSSELSLDTLLQKLVETAAALTGARYAALGVIDPSGAALERFFTHGTDAETHERIGLLPRGRGILGVLIRDAKPLRLDDLMADPRAAGFPPNHPPMHGFLGVPILLRGVAYGNLYLTEKEGAAAFTEEDEDVATLFASQAAVAIENARLYESATRWLRQLESLNEVSTALVGEFELPRLLGIVCLRLRELLGARVVCVALPDPDGTLRIAASDGMDFGGLRLPRDSKSSRILERRRSERVNSVIDDPEVDQEFARIFGARAQVWVPLLVRERAIGVVLAIDKEGPDPRFTEDDLRLAESFAQRASVAVDLSERVARDALRRVVAAQELERRRLARELHDETGQALTSILLGLRSLEEVGDPEAVARAAGDLRELVVSTLQDVRRLAVELRPKALDDFGLVPALKRLAESFTEQTRIGVDVEARLPEERLAPEIETAVYRIVQEALTNVVKHARARNVSILLSRKNGRVSVMIEDDGQGFDPARTRADGLGLLGMRERAALLDGTLSIESSNGAGTTLVLDVPVR
jgi:signal transduction histidine kinase